MIKTKIILFIYFISVIFIVFLHELIHWIFAVKFKRNPKIHISRFFTPAISYKNNNNNLQNLIISASSPIILTLLGLIISSSNQYLVVAKIFLLSNIINLTPFTQDGEVILLSIIKLIRKEEL